MKELDRKRWEDVQKVLSTILESLRFQLRYNYFFFDVPTELFDLLLSEDDYSKNKDLIDSIVLRGYPILIREIKRVRRRGDDYDAYYFVRVLYSEDGKKISEKKIQYDCYQSISEAPAFLLVLSYFLNFERIFELLEDVGLGKLIWR
jgi:hypothetical protein